METPIKDGGVGLGDGGGGKLPNNSAERANGGLPYEPVPHPAGVKGLGDSMNMWALYLKVWTVAATADIKALESRVAALEKKADSSAGETHLDPPPDPPYDPPPT